MTRSTGTEPRGQLIPGQNTAVNAAGSQSDNEFRRGRTSLM